MMIVGPLADKPNSQGAFWRPRVRMAVMALLFFGTVALLWPATRGPFLPGDDYRFIVDNGDIHHLNWASLRRIFASIHGDLYQPAPILSAAINWHFSADDPFGYRLTEIVLHAINGCLLWTLVRLISGSDFVGFMASILWTIHPVHTRAYTGDFARTHILAGSCFLICLFCYRKSEGGRWWIWYALALLSAALELLSKPVVGLLGVLVLVDLHGGHRRIIPLIRRLAPLAAMAAVISVLTLKGSKAFGLLDVVGESLLGSPYSRAAAAITLYSRNILFPRWLSTWYLQPPGFSWASPEVWIGVALFVASAVGIILTWRRLPLVAVGLGWFWFTLVQSLGFFGERYAVGNDCYLYQPLMGLSLSLASGIDALSKRIKPDWGPRGVVIAQSGMVVMYASIFAMVVRSTLSDFSDILGRARRVVALYPHDPRVYENLGMAHQFLRLYPVEARELSSTEEHRRAEIEAFRSAGSIANVRDYYPTAETCVRFLLRIATRQFELGDHDGARKTADRVLSFRPVEDSAILEYARWLARCGFVDAAVEAYRALIDSRPANFGLRREVGDAYSSAGYHSEAALWYGEALQRQPDDIPSLLGSGRTALALGQLQEAARRAAEVRRYSPANLDAKALLARALVRDGLIEDASRLASEVLAHSPAHREGRLAMADLRLREGQAIEACRRYELLLDENATDEDALRGLLEAAAQADALPAAQARIEAAARLKPWHKGIAELAASIASQNVQSQSPIAD